MSAETSTESRLLATHNGTSGEARFDGGEDRSPIEEFIDTMRQHAARIFGVTETANEFSVDPETKITEYKYTYGEGRGFLFARIYPEKIFELILEGFPSSDSEEERHLTIHQRVYTEPFETVTTEQIVRDARSDESGVLQKGDTILESFKQAESQTEPEDGFFYRHTANGSIREVLLMIPGDENLYHCMRAKSNSGPDTVICFRYANGGPTGEPIDVEEFLSVYTQVKGHFDAVDSGFAEDIFEDSTEGDSE